MLVTTPILPTVYVNIDNNGCKSFVIARYTDVEEYIRLGPEDALHVLEELKKHLEEV